MIVLLDLDGTLTDPYPGITRCVEHALRSLGLPALSPAEARAFIGPPLQDSFARLGLSAGLVERAVALYRERFSEHGLYENRLYDGIVPALEQLRGAGARLAVATSKPTVFAERIVDHFALSPLLELVVGASLDGRRSVKSDVIAFALSALGDAPSGAVMVGDRSQDVVGAKANGLPAVGVRWGYAEPGELEEAGADQILDSPAELGRLRCLQRP